MEQNLSLAVQVALLAVSGALIVLVAVCVRALLRFEKQCERVVTAVERVEAEFTPLAREARVAVDRLSDLSSSAQAAAEIAGGWLLPPVRIINKAAELLRTGATAFFQALLTRRNRVAREPNRESLERGILPS